MNFPKISKSIRLERLEPPEGQIRMVIDTDTYNEIDDQFAIVYALFSPEKLSVEGLYAAPFFNQRSTSPGNGMDLSYDEILRLLDKLNKRSLENIVFRGSDDFLTDYDHPFASDAVNHLIELAMSSDEPLYVVAIGALTNIASAILVEPKIIEKIILVWLGGHALHWPDTNEFNLAGDLLATQLILNCGVPLVLIPAFGVTTHLLTTVSEIDQFVRGQGAIGDFLANTYKAYRDIRFGGSKEIWDIVAIGYLINSDWVPSYITSSPMVAVQPSLEEPGLNPYPRDKHQLTWSFDHSRHLIRYAYYVKRDPIFMDLFSKLKQFANG